MPHHATTATPPGNKATKGGKTAPAGHWVTVDGRPLFLHGERGHETAADRAANAKALGGRGAARRPSTELAHRPPKSLREQAAEHRAAKGVPEERSRRLLARAQKQYQKSRTSAKRHLKAEHADKAGAAVDRTAHHAARVEKLAAPATNAKWAHARVTGTKPYNPHEGGAETTVEPGSHAAATSRKTTLRDHVAAHAQSTGTKAPAPPKQNYFARRKAEGHAPPPGKHGGLGSHAHEGPRPTLRDKAAAPAGRGTPTPKPAPRPAPSPAPAKKSLREQAAEHRAKNAPGKTETHADTAWARAKEHQARGEKGRAEAAFSRHDALMRRAAKRSDARAPAEAAKDKPSLRELAAAHAKAKAEKAEAAKPKSLRDQAAEARARKGTPESRSRQAATVTKLRGKVAAGRDPSSHTDHPAGHVGELKTSLIHFDPDRFQYKLAAQGEHGVTDALSGVKKYDPNLGGVLQVWKDPKDGKTYVVNGHHRLDLANKLGADKVAVRFLGSKSAEEARGVGALTNIAEGRGNSVDAAKFIRSTGHTRAALEEAGVPMKERIATEGLALANLHEPIFKRVIDQDITPARGAILGHGTSHAQQTAIVKGVNKLPKSRQPSDATLRNAVEDAKLAPTVTKTTRGLFGDDAEDFSLGLHRGELAAHVQERLGREKRIFGTVAKARNAEELASAGNVIDTEASAAKGSAADQNLQTFNLLRRSKSPVSDLLNEGAERIHKGEKKKAVHDDIYKRLPAAVQAALG